VSMSDDNNPNEPTNEPTNEPDWRERTKNRLHGLKEQGREFLERGRSPYPDPPGKAGQMKYGCQPYEVEPSDYIITLENDLANSYHWSGNFWEDYIFFVCQWHPLIGILACHPYHPWSKLERLKMFVISTAVSMVPAILVAKRVEDSFPEDADELKKSATLFFTLIFVTLPDIIVGVVLYQLSIANTRCPLCTCWVTINKCCSNGFLCIAIAACGLSYYILQDTHPDEILGALKPLGKGKLYSLGTWFPIWFVLPCVGFCLVWRGEHSEALKNNNNQPAAE